MDWNNMSLCLFYDYDARQSYKQDKINEELMRRKRKALTKISQNVSPALVESIASLISSKEVEGNTYAETIIELCDLEEEEILALREDKRGIYDDLLKDEDDEYMYG